MATPQPPFTDPKMFRQLVDQITSLVLLIQRWHTTSRRNAAASRLALAASKRAVTLLEQMRPGGKGRAV